MLGPEVVELNGESRHGPVEAGRSVRRSARAACAPTRVRVPGEVPEVAILAVLAGVDGWDEIAEWPEACEACPLTPLEVPTGVESADTVRRRFQAIVASKFAECLERLVAELRGVALVQVVCIDGETMRRTFARDRRQAPLHLVSAWARSVACSSGRSRRRRRRARPRRSRAARPDRRARADREHRRGGPPEHARRRDRRGGRRPPARPRGHPAVASSGGHRVLRPGAAGSNVRSRADRVQRHRGRGSRSRRDASYRPRRPRIVQAGAGQVAGSSRDREGRARARGRRRADGRAGPLPEHARARRRAHPRAVAAARERRERAAPGARHDVRRGPVAHPRPQRGDQPGAAARVVAARARAVRPAQEPRDGPPSRRPGWDNDRLFTGFRSAAPGRRLPGGATTGRAARRRGTASRGGVVAPVGHVGDRGGVPRGLGAAERPAA